MVTVSALATTLFLGGWRAPWPISAIRDGLLNEGYWPFLWFIGKVMLFIFVFIWLRGSLPAAALRPVHGVRLEAADPDLAGLDRRGRHDPRGHASTAASTGSYLLGRDRRRRGAVPGAVLRRRARERAAEDEPSRRRGAAFDAFAGGYPVPPMPGTGHRRSGTSTRRPSTGPPPPMGSVTDAHPQGTVLGPDRGLRGHLPDDVPQGRHRAVPVREEADRAALPRPAPAQPLARRAGEVHRLRAVRLGLPGRRDLRRGRLQHRGASGSRPASATAASTRSTTCAASCAGCASRRARPAR